MPQFPLRTFGAHLLLPWVYKVWPKDGVCPLQAEALEGWRWAQHVHPAGTLGPGQERQPQAGLAHRERRRPDGRPCGNREPS